MDAIKEGMLASAKAAEVAARIGESLFGGKQKFNSQVATNRSQSERLLALGLKKETADCRWERIGQMYGYYVAAKKPYVSSDIPAWSLHRLIEMCDINPFIFYTNCGYDNVIDRIEELIKEGYFPKEYLV